MDPAVKRAVLRAFSYGLYAVGVCAGGRINLFTANWLTQVAFEPPLLALSVESDAYSLELIREGGVFAVSVLRADQREVAATLRHAYRRQPDKVHAFPHRPAPSGCPVLDDCLGWVDCRVVGSLPAGDHALFLAEVTDAGLPEGAADAAAEPLLMRAAGFRYAG